MSLKPWKVLSSKIIHHTPWLDVKVDTCEVDGQQLEYTYTHRTSQGPTIIAESDDQKLWLVKQYRHPIKKTLWQFPVEGKPESETWEDAAHRGLAEELHLKANILINLGTIYPDPGGLEQITQYFLARDLTPIDGQFHSELGENLLPEAFSLSELDRMIEMGEVCDAWTVTGVHLYHKYVK